MKIRDRQVSKFNRLLHKNNLNGNLEGRQKSPQIIIKLVVGNLKVIHVSIIIMHKVLAIAMFIKVTNG